MIGKAGLGSYAKGILEYCYYEKELTAKQRQQLDITDVRGDLVYVQHLAVQFLADKRLDLNDLASQFLDNMDKNRRLTKFMWHQSFSFPPGENPSHEQITRIAIEFAKEFGFEHNQMLVFKHEDTAHPHFHVVANRLNYNGKNTADHFNNYARTGKFCRRMELELGLSITPDMHLTNESKPRQSVDRSLNQLKETIDGILPGISSFEQLSEALLKQGYKTYLGRGIAFFNTKNRMKVKGSDIGREYSLSSLQKRMGVQRQVSIKADLKKSRKLKKDLGIGL